MKTKVLFLIALITAISANAQVTFEKIITRNSHEEIMSVIPTADGGYAMVAGSGLSGTGQDLWLVRTDSHGDTVWTRTYYGAGDVHTTDRALVQTSDGGFTFIIRRNGNVNLLHTSAAGDSLWEKQLSDRNCYSLSPTSSGGYISSGEGSTNLTFRICCADASGNILWMREYQPYPDTVWLWPDGWAAIREVPAGGFIVAGNLNTGFFNSKPFLLRINASGDSLWYNEPEGFYNARVYSIDTTGSTGFYMCGMDQTFGSVKMIMKMNYAGYVEWIRKEDREEQEGYLSVRTTPDGGAIACGFEEKMNDSAKAVLARYDAAGNLLWDRKFGKYYAVWGGSVECTADSGFIIAGGMIGTEASPNRGILIKTGADGNITGVDDKVEAAGLSFYPNPATQTTTFRIAPDHIKSDARLTLYDPYGRRVKTKMLLRSQEACQMDVSDLPPGIYLAIVKSEGLTLARGKVVVQLK